MAATPGYRTNRGLFSNRYLDERLPETEAWNADEAAVRSAREALESLYREEAGRAADYDERGLRRNLLEPAFEALGLASATESAVSGERPRPDYVLFESERAGDAGTEGVAAVADAERWDRPLDPGDRRDGTDPSRRLRRSLDATGVSRAILTNGRTWRLYCGRAVNRFDAYYEVDLPELLATGDPEEFKYFYLFFRRDGFAERVRSESERFAEELVEDLRENVREALSVLARGFIEADDADSTDLDAVYEASLTYLYRLVFVLYAESDGRDLLDDEGAYRRRYGLSALARRVADERDGSGPDPAYRASGTALADRLDELFALVDEGSRARGVPPEEFHVPAYDGELFESDPEASETAAFLDAHAVGDACLARVIDLLARRETDRGDGREFVDYSSLDVRHLGSIYEGLLEYDLEVADRDGPDGNPGDDLDDSGDDPDDSGDAERRVEPGEVYLAGGDADERKATGSYYTPEFVVEYVVERALEPLLDEIRADLDPTDPDYAEEFAEHVFDLSVLDPAMGSGHFLVETVEYLSRAVVAARREQAERAGTETVGDARDGRRVAARSIDWARRQVARRCVYGVDANGMAVELAKASLWLRTATADRPLVPLDNRLACGDALAGADALPEADPTEGGESAAFDAVVGNPPYVRSRNLPDDRKEYYREAFETARGAYDLYVPFAELAADLGRRASLVVPNKWTTTDYGRALRDRLLDAGLREVLDASNLDVFPDADVYPVVVTFGESPSRRDGDGGEEIRVRRPDGDADSDPEEARRLADAPTAAVPRSLVDRLGGRVIPLDMTPEFADLAERVLVRCDRLGDHATLTEGVHTGNVREKLVVEDGESDRGESDGETRRNDGETRRKLVDGSSVGRYRLDWDGRWLRYDESLVGPGEYADFRTPDCFEGEKLLVADISDRPVAVHDDADHYPLNTLYSVQSRADSSSPSLRYLLGVFNSEFVATYYRQVYGGTHVSGGYLRFKPMFAERIPVPDPDSAPVGPEEVAAVAELTGVGGENLPGDPESAVATLTERVRSARDRRAELDVDVTDYLGRSASDPTGETLGAVGVSAEGVADTILAETTADRDGLRVGEVRVERADGGTARDGTGSLVLSATARYKPADGERDDAETDRWGYVETDPVPAMRFPDLDPTERTLVEAFVPRAVGAADGFAGFRETATKTNSLLDRLRALTLPDVGRTADEIARYRKVRAEAEALDDRIAALEEAIDDLVYRLYGLDDEEVEAVERF